MSEVPRLTIEQERFIDQHVRIGPKSRTRPHITLTYATSLDGKIAILPGARTALSGTESKSMTHYLRKLHDGILIGVGTALSDDPSLNCRYPSTTSPNHPRPIVVDPRARWDVWQSKVYGLKQQEQGKLPLVFVADPPSNPQPGAVHCPVPTLKENSQVVRPMQTASNGRFEWEVLFKVLLDANIQSVMIEGGATVINDLLIRPNLVDSIIVTVAPTYLGGQGVGIGPRARDEGGKRTNPATIADAEYMRFGNDVVVAGTLR